MRLSLAVTATVIVLALPAFSRAEDVKPPDAKPETASRPGRLSSSTQGAALYQPLAELAAYWNSGGRGERGEKSP